MQNHPTDHEIEMPGAPYAKAVQNLKSEIDSLYDDLMQDDNFSEEWLNYKKFLYDQFRA